MCKTEKTINTVWSSSVTVKSYLTKTFHENLIIFFFLISYLPFFFHGLYFQTYFLKFRDFIQLCSYSLYLYMAHYSQLSSKEFEQGERHQSHTHIHTQTQHRCYNMCRERRHTPLIRESANTHKQTYLTCCDLSKACPSWPTCALCS